MSCAIPPLLQSTYGKALSARRNSSTDLEHGTRVRVGGHIVTGVTAWTPYGAPEHRALLRIPALQGVRAPGQHKALGKNPGGVVRRVGFRDPVGASRALKPKPGGFRETVESPSGVVCRRRVGLAPGEARRAGNRERIICERRSDRGVLSFGDFSLDEQRKATCPGSTTQK